MNGDEIELIRRHYGDFGGLYDQSQAVAHVRVLLAEIDRLTVEMSEHKAKRDEFDRQLLAEFDQLRGRVAELEAQRDKVLALHSECAGLCVYCSGPCLCGDEAHEERCHGSQPWPCPTAAIYAAPAPADPTAEMPIADRERELFGEQAAEHPPLTDLVGLDPDFTGGLTAADHLARQRGEMTSAEQNALDKAKAWREALPWQTGVPRDTYAKRLADTQDALIAAVDGLPAEREGGA